MISKGLSYTIRPPVRVGVTVNDDDYSVIVFFDNMDHDLGSDPFITVEPESVPGNVSEKLWELISHLAVDAAQQNKTTTVYKGVV